MPEETNEPPVRTYPGSPLWWDKAPLDYHGAWILLSGIIGGYPEGYTYIKVNGNGPSCLYWHESEGKPGCLIGQLLHKMGAPADLLRACDTATRGGTLDKVISTGMLPGVFEVRTGMALRHLQQNQDDGKPWTVAMEHMESFWQGLRAGQRHAEREAAYRIAE